MDRVPPELLDSILSLVPRAELQHTTLGLLLALPRSPISLALLWRHLRLTREGQSWAAALSLHATSSTLRNAVQTANVEAWRDDPQLLINLLGSLPNLNSLRSTIGPLFQPEHLEELLEAPAWRGTVEQVWLRFNPYVTERSYYTFLKGAYFDSTPLGLASWPASSSPRLRRLAFVQDLPPNHGVAVKETPAFGLVSDLVDELAALAPPSKRMNRTEGKMDFAQPIVFFKLFCLSVLALSPVGAQLTHLVLRLPRRNLLTALTAYPLHPLPTPFASLTSLDLSTTHLIADARFPLFLRLHATLTHIVLDRCTGLIGSRETPEQYLPTLRWLGKCIGGVGASRSEDVVRAWRKLIKDRPTGVPAPGPRELATPIEKKKRAGRSGYGNMPKARPTATAPPATTTTTTHPALVWKSELVPLVKEVLHIPPAPKMLAVGLGLFPLSPAMDLEWREAFQEGYTDAIVRTADKIEDALHRWERWKNAGQLEDGTRRMVVLRDALPAGSDSVDRDYEEPDIIFRRFCEERGLVVIGPEAALEVLACVSQARCGVCFVPDCPGEPGVPHLSLSIISKELIEEREAREKGIWEREKREREGWRRPEWEHRSGCAHLVNRGAWSEES